MKNKSTTDERRMANGEEGDGRNRSGREGERDRQRGGKGFAIERRYLGGFPGNAMKQHKHRN